MKENHASKRSALKEARVLVVGAGGLGCPALYVLAHAGVGTIGIADDDDVEASNLHRQILFSESDVGKNKCDVAARVLAEKFPNTTINVHHTRILPENSRQIVREYDLVVEGSDNFPTKFLVSDACLLEGKRVVHGAAIKWHGTALSVAAHGAPCYRCVFEEIPWEQTASCASAGVMGPVVGVVAAKMADLALLALSSPPQDACSAGTLFSYDGKKDVLRDRVIARRKSCESCGDEKRLASIDQARYSPQIAARA